MLAAKRAALGGRALPVRVLSSPLERAVRTAEAVSRELRSENEVVLEDRLVELDYGEFDGLRLSEVRSADWAAWRADISWRPPGGETLEELQARVTSFCDEYAALAHEGDVIAVSHVSPIKAATAWALGAGPEIAWRLSLSVASMTEIATSPPALRTFGETGHLVGLG